jgi:amidase
VPWPTNLHGPVQFPVRLIGKVNCSNEIFFVLALQHAIELDEFYIQTGKTVGSLHGLPISLKDQFRVKGVETSMGYIAWLG